MKSNNIYYVISILSFIWNTQITNDISICCLHFCCSQDSLRHIKINSLEKEVSWEKWEFHYLQSSPFLAVLIKTFKLLQNSEEIDIGYNWLSKLANIEVSKIPNDFLMNRSTHNSVLMLENMFETHLKLQHEGLLTIPIKNIYIMGNWATIMYEQDSLSQKSL